MRAEHDRAFKEWAVVCEALREGRQTVLIRKGGIREEDGVFRVDDREFFLMPTHEHQNAALIRPGAVPELGRKLEASFDPRTITLDAYATVELVAECRDEACANALAGEHVWNEEYVRMRFDFNPYDPVYVLMLRVYRLPQPVSLPVRPAYVGCKSWVTLERPISTAGAVAGISDAEFAERRAAVEGVLRGT